ncbi:MAG TPA: sialidase family protein [Bacteroidota bacterium]
MLFTRTEEHLGPDGAILGTRSTDNGKTWQSPSVIYDTPIDDRESGITLLSDGTIVAHLWSTFHTRAGYDALADLSYERSTLKRWSDFVDAPGYRASMETEGAWTISSRDHGRTWSKPVKGCDAVHGGIQLRNGTLLVASYRRDYPRIGVYCAVLPEMNFTRISSIQSPTADSIVFGEPHILQLSSGRVIMMIRATALGYNDTSPRCVLWETYSDDNGGTWVQPVRTPLWGFPPHLLQLSDGRILCSYGYRRAPFGERACISDDGISWELGNEIVLRDDAPNGDLGYPASVELDSGRILTVFYQPNVPKGVVQKMHPPDSTRTKPGILGTVWAIPSRSSR